MLLILTLVALSIGEIGLQKTESSASQLQLAVADINDFRQQEMQFPAADHEKQLNTNPQRANDSSSGNKIMLMKLKVT